MAIPRYCWDLTSALLWPVMPPQSRFGRTAPRSRRQVALDQVASPSSTIAVAVLGQPPVGLVRTGSANAATHIQSETVPHPFCHSSSAAATPLRYPRQHLIFCLTSRLRGLWLATARFCRRSTSPDCVRTLGKRFSGPVESARSPRSRIAARDRTRFVVGDGPVESHLEVRWISVDAFRVSSRRALSAT